MSRDTSSSARASSTATLRQMGQSSPRTHRAQRSGSRQLLMAEAPSTAGHAHRDRLTLCTVVRDDSHDLAGGIQLHELRRLGALLIAIAHDDAAHAPHDVEDLEAKIRVDLEAFPEVRLQGRD